jgi:MFS family permease
VPRRTYLTAQALRIRPFRRLWLVLALSSVGDWLGLLGSAVFASSQVSAPAAKGAAFGVVIAIQLLPALLLGPVAGLLADRLDRRLTMIAVDVFRFVLYLSIPVAALLSPGGAVAYAAIAVFLIQSAALLWVPAKEAAVPKLLPRALLESANQLTLVTTYGVAPVVGALLLASLAQLPSFSDRIGPVGLALWFDAMTFLASAMVVTYGIRELSGRAIGPSSRPTVRAMAGDVVAGTRFVMTNRLVRGIVIGILGAFAGAGVVIGTGRFYAQSLGGGDSTFAILFAVLFTGFGLGIVGGPRLVGLWSRRRSFTTSIVIAGIALVGLSMAPRLEPAVLAALIVGTAAGMAFLTGITLIGRDVSDTVRGRVFAFIQTGARVTLLGSIAASGVLVGLGSSRRLRVDGVFNIAISSTRALLLLAGIGGIYLGWAALRQIDDRRGVPVLKDLSAIALRRPIAPYPPARAVRSTPMTAKRRRSPYHRVSRRRPPV